VLLLDYLLQGDVWLQRKERVVLVRDDLLLKELFHKPKEPFIAAHDPRLRVDRDDHVLSRMDNDRSWPCLLTIDSRAVSKKRWVISGRPRRRPSGRVAIAA